MHRLLLFLTLFFTSYFSYSQQLHTPDQLLEIIEKSKITYEIDSLANGIAPKSYPIIESGLQIVRNGEKSALVSSKIGTSKEYEKYQKKANKLIAKRKYSKVILIYEKLLNNDPDNLELKKKLADLYQKDESLDKAEETYSTILEKNPIDFENLSSLSFFYQKKGEKDKAIRYGIRAHLMNRNDEELKNGLERVLLENGFTYLDWEFRPNYALDKQRGVVNIKFAGNPWLAYGVCKAVWENETEYVEQMKTVSDAPVAEIEEKECLLNALLTYNSLKTEKINYPELKGLALALSSKMINRYIVYEIEARENPKMLLTLSDDRIEELIEYFLKVHVSNK